MKTQRFYFEILIRLYKGLPVELTNNINKKQAIKILEREVMLNLETLWNVKVISGIAGAENLDLALKQRFQQAQARNIITQIQALAEGEEYCCQSGYSVGANGHCLYISFTKQIHNQVLIRIDNRWVMNGRRDGQMHGQTPWTTTTNPPQIRPYWLGTIKIDDKRLLEYINSIVLAYSEENATAAIEKIYPRKGLGERSDNPTHWPIAVQKWPTQNKQTNAHNCTMSSHNFGVMIRAGELSPLLFNFERAQIWQEVQGAANAEPLAHAALHGTGVKYTGAPKATMFQPPSVSTAVPTHEALMRHLARELKVDYTEVYSGIAVEQTLVNMAQITTVQTGAQYRRLKNGDTRFWLRLNAGEKQQFIECHGQQFQGLIRQVGDSSGGLVTFDLNTNILFSQVALALGNYRNQHNSTQLATQSTPNNGCCLQ